MKKLVLYEKATEMKVCIPITLKESKPRRKRRKKEQYMHSEKPALKIYNLINQKSLRFLKLHWLHLLSENLK